MDVDKRPLSRWQQFYQENSDLGAIEPSQSAAEAARIFAQSGSQIVLDLGCGTGRDSIHLAGNRAMVVGLDAALAGLKLAQERAKALPFMLSWIESDARCLPLADSSFDGVYCFGLLHEFVGNAAETDVERLMDEVHRILKPSGVLIIAAAAGDPQKGLPHVQNFTEAMFDNATRRFGRIEKRLFDDLGCTGRTDYKVWFGHFIKVFSEDHGNNVGKLKNLYS